MVQSSNEHLRDLQIRHAIYLLRFGNGAAQAIIELLNDAETDVAERIGARLALIKERGFDLGPASTKRLETLLEEIRVVNDNVYKTVYADLDERLGGLADAEAEFQKRALETAITVDVQAKLPSPTLLKTIATTRPFQGDLLKNHVNGMAAGNMSRMTKAIRNGIIQGQSIDKIVAATRGPEGFEKSRESARKTIRTAVNHVANQAAQETWKANDHLVKRWQFVATLDSRTTPQCGSNDGKDFPIGEGPIPPIHWQCRSVSIAVTKSFAEMGLKEKDHSPDKRASVDGQLAKPVGFEAWLRNQSTERQDTVLGKTRADLWRAGTFKLADFVRDGREVITLDELKRLHPERFNEGSAPTPAQKPEPAPAPAKKRFTGPIDPAVTDATVTVEPRKEVQKALGAKVAQAAKDSRYTPTPEFRGIQANQLGKVALPASLTDEAASMVKAIYPELDTLADAFGVPRLRAIKSGNGSYIATMGDGVLTINPTYLNGYANKIGDQTGETPLKKLTDQRDALALELRAMRDEIEQHKAKLLTLEGKEREEFTYRYLDLVDGFNAKRGVFMKLDKQVLKARTTDRVAKQDEASTWKPGDDPKERPYNATAYFTGMDRTRMVLYHEFSHHVHQQLGKQGPRNRFGKPPLERQLEVMFREGGKRDKQASTYATSNGHEWWAENFGLYMMGRRDLVDERIAALIERILDEVNSG